DDFVERETAFHYGLGKIIQLFERTFHAMGETRIDLRLAVTGPACEPVEQPAEKSGAAILLAQMVTHHIDAVGEVHHEFFRQARQGIAQRWIRPDRPRIVAHAYISLAAATGMTSGRRPPTRASSSAQSVSRSAACRASLAYSSSA